MGANTLGAKRGGAEQRLGANKDGANPYGAKKWWSRAKAGSKLRGWEQKTEEHSKN